MRVTRRTISQATKRTSADPSAGGIARAKSLSAGERSEIAREAALKRWGKSRAIEAGGEDAKLDPDTVGESDLAAADASAMPVAAWKGVLQLPDTEPIPCYVLNDGRRLIGRTSATEMLTGIKGGGAFEKYIGVSALQAYINVEAVQDKMVAFRLPEVEGLERRVRGLPADELIEVCRGFVAALNASTQSTATFKLILPCGLRQGWPRSFD
jgi:hypothetical protein